MEENKFVSLVTRGAIVLITTVVATEICFASTSGLILTQVAINIARSKICEDLANKYQDMPNPKEPADMTQEDLTPWVPTQPEIQAKAELKKQMEDIGCGAKGKP